MHADRCVSGAWAKVWRTVVREWLREMAQTFSWMCLGDCFREQARESGKSDAED
jgi:hypothetical protein